MPSLSRLFNCDFERDYENVWEWAEGYSQKYQVNINVSRAHEDWSGDEFINPLMILFNPTDFNFNSLALVQSAAMKISNELSIEVYYGYLTITGDDGYEYYEIGKAAGKLRS